jgi:hypothetical protein
MRTNSVKSDRARRKVICTRRMREASKRRGLRTQRFEPLGRRMAFHHQHARRKMNGHGSRSLVEVHASSPTNSLDLTIRLRVLFQPGSSFPASASKLRRAELRRGTRLALLIVSTPFFSCLRLTNKWIGYLRCIGCGICGQHLPSGHLRS